MVLERKDGGIVSTHQCDYVYGPDDSTDHVFETLGASPDTPDAPRPATPPSVFGWRFLPSLTSPPSQALLWARPDTNPSTRSPPL